MVLHREAGNAIYSASKDAGEVWETGLPEVKPLERWAGRRVKMTLNQFSFFFTVAKLLSLTKASAELRVSQPTITQQLRELAGC
jgi:hypothetical protein